MKKRPAPETSFHIHSMQKTMVPKRNTTECYKQLLFRSKYMLKLTCHMTGLNGACIVHARPQRLVKQQKWHGMRNVQANGQAFCRSELSSSPTAYHYSGI